LHGEVRSKNPEVYKWVKECLVGKNERIAALEAENTQLKADLADRDAHYMDVLGSYDALKDKLARMEAPVSRNEWVETGRDLAATVRTARAKGGTTNG
jgi:uncharacterized protein YdcH (DUF465 family)